MESFINKYNFPLCYKYAPASFFSKPDYVDFATLEAHLGSMDDQQIAEWLEKVEKNGFYFPNGECMLPRGWVEESFCGRAVYKGDFGGATVEKNSVGKWIVKPNNKDLTAQFSGAEFETRIDAIGALSTALSRQAGKDFLGEDIFKKLFG